MDFESFHCSDIVGVEEMVTASLLILLMNGTKKHTEMTWTEWD